MNAVNNQLTNQLTNYPNYQQTN